MDIVQIPIISDFDVDAVVRMAVEYAFHSLSIVLVCVAVFAFVVAVLEILDN